MIELWCRPTRRVAIQDQFIGDATVQEFIARENIRRFEAQLAACTDPKQRKTLSRLLEAEQQRLTQALAEKNARPEAS